MKQSVHTVSRFALAAGAAWAFSAAAAAQPPVAPAPDALPTVVREPVAPAPCGGPGAPHRQAMPGVGLGGMPGGHHTMAPGESDGIAGLALDDAQRDKVFAIRHAVAPELRKAMQEARAARRALHELVTSGGFDESKGLELSRREAAALSQATLLRASTEHQLLAVLTPQQRQQLAQRPVPRPGEGGHRAGPRGPQRADMPAHAVPGKS